MYNLDDIKSLEHIVQSMEVEFIPSFHTKISPKSYSTLRKYITGFKMNEKSGAIILVKGSEFKMFPLLMKLGITIPADLLEIAKK